MDSKTLGERVPPNQVQNSYGSAAGEKLNLQQLAKAVCIVY